ncbi:hypothetical protein B296_00029068 [Ensete ventricosum]|uniref:Uncharacterized protein n=1 Tax=Ensete ventricosum TaxID=4639 RepID=A0A426XIA8_ENSVE|nr:hypothetical protein B296_00029068 [Ensete ventricosum]
MLHALPVPDPAPVQLHPATSTAASPSLPAATIPAFPEQSDVASATCPLDLPSDLLPSVTAACTSPSASGSHLRLPSRSRCCPALAAWLYAAYSPSALAARPLPSAGFDLPALPDDSESCAAGVERAMRDRGVALPRANATCDAAYCYCGVRLRRLACAGGFVADTAAGLWGPAGGRVRRRVRGGHSGGSLGPRRRRRASFGEGLRSAWPHRVQSLPPLYSLSATQVTTSSGSMHEKRLRNKLLRTFSVVSLYFTACSSMSTVLIWAAEGEKAAGQRGERIGEEGGRHPWQGMPADGSDVAPLQEPDALPPVRHRDSPRPHGGRRRRKLGSDLLLALTGRHAARRRLYSD